MFLVGGIIKVCLCIGCFNQRDFRPPDAMDGLNPLGLNPDGSFFLSSWFRLRWLRSLSLSLSLSLFLFLSFSFSFSLSFSLSLSLSLAISLSLSLSLSLSHAHLTPEGDHAAQVLRADQQLRDLNPRNRNHLNQQGCPLSLSQFCPTNLGSPSCFSLQC